MLKNDGKCKKRDRFWINILELSFYQYSEMLLLFPQVPVNVPYILETFCKYLISLSGALALLNVVPCYALDGQWILLGFLDLVLGHFRVKRDTREVVYTVIMLLGSGVLISNVIIAMLSLIQQVNVT